mmetsp:Transcript_36711/g.42224  ORF Transcript_36711/g.42224 Transcript_36711/m.42224 type:complete len:87 (+) Transcript_36711:655-915(+)
MKNKPGIRTMNPSFRDPPRANNTTTIDYYLKDKFNFNVNHKPSDFLFTKVGKYRKESNFRDIKRFRLTQRRTATNSPAYTDVSLAS